MGDSKKTRVGWCFQAWLFATAVWLVACLIVVGTVRNVRANENGETGETAPPSLAHLVPADAGLCIEIHQPAANLARLNASEFGRRLQHFGPLSWWTEQYQSRIVALGRYLSRRLNVDLDELGRRLLGNETVVAIWPPDEARHGLPPFGKGLVIMRATDADLLRRAAEVLTSDHPAEPRHDKKAQQTDPAKCDLRRVEHAGFTYRVRTVHHGERSATVCLAVVGRLGVITTSEPVIRRVLELKAHLGEAESLADTANYRSAARRWRRNAAIKVFLQPRPWDKAVMAEAAEISHEAPDVGERFAVQVAAEVWKASRFWIATADFHMPLLIDAYLSIDRKALSGPAQAVLASMTGETELLRHVPDDAALAFAGRVDIGRMARLLLAVGDEDSLQQLETVRTASQNMLLGLDLFDDVLTQIGPDVSSFLESGESPGPAHWVMAVKIRPRAAGDSRPSIEQAIDNGLRTAMMMSAALVNSKGDGSQAHVETVEVEGTRFTSLEGIDAGTSPLGSTYAFRDGYFIMGASRDDILRSLSIEPEQSLAASPRLKRLLSPLIHSPSHVVFVDAAAIRRMLDNQQETLVTMLSAARHMERDAVRERLLKLSTLLSLTESIALAAEVDDDGIAISFGLTTKSLDP